MAQWTDSNLITATDDGVDVANQINNLRAAFNSGSSGAARPTNAVAGMVYSKTVAGGFQPVMVTGAGTEVALGTVTTATGAYALPIDVIEAALISSGRGVPSGTVIMYAAGGSPTGYLKCNGAAVSRTTYAALFAAIGTTWGVGNGSTTFNVPDLRGEFVRGWDDARGVDSGRVFGSVQSGAVQTHEHDIEIRTDDGALGTNTPGSAGPQGVPGGGTWGRGTIYAAKTPTGGFAAAGPLGPETRPRNVAALYCIKF